MALADLTISYQGLVMGAGTSYAIQTVHGLDDLPDIDSADLDPVRHGEVRGIDYMRGRTITVELVVKGVTAAGLAALLVDFRAALAVQSEAEPPLNFKLPSLSERIVYCRPRRRSMPIDLGFTHSKFSRAVVEFHATDPNIYDATQTSTVLV